MMTHFTPRHLARLFLLILVPCICEAQPRILTKPNSSEAIALTSPELIALPAVLQDDQRIMIFVEGSVSLNTEVEGVYDLPNTSIRQVVIRPHLKEGQTLTLTLGQSSATIKRLSTPYKPLAFASFYAPDGSLPSAETGQIWEPLGCIGVADYQASSKCSDGSSALLNFFGPAKRTISVTVNNAEGLQGQGIIFGYQDSKNYYQAILYGTFGVRLMKVSDGKFEILKHISNVSGKVLSVELSDGIKVKLDDLFVCSVDEIVTSGRDGIYIDNLTGRLSDFTIDSAINEGFIGIISPVQDQTFQRVQNKADIPVSGRYEGTPVGIEARWNNGEWKSLAFVNGEYSGTLKDQPVGTGLLEVRFTNNHKTVSRTRHVSIGDVYLIAGQSNAAGRGHEKQFSDARFSVFDQTGHWRVGYDPSHTGSGGSMWPLIASRLKDTGVPVAFIATAIGQQGLIGDGGLWRPGFSVFNACVDAVKASRVNGIKAVLWYDGESDANIPNITQVEMENALQNWHSGLSDALGFGDLDVLMFQISMIDGFAATPQSISAVRNAQQHITETNPYFFGPVVLSDLDLSQASGGDGVHIQRTSDLQIAAQRASGILLGRFYQ